MRRPPSERYRACACELEKARSRDCPLDSVLGGDGNGHLFGFGTLTLATRAFFAAAGASPVAGSARSTPAEVTGPTPATITRACFVATTFTVAGSSFVAIAVTVTGLRAGSATFAAAFTTALPVGCTVPGATAAGATKPTRSSLVVMPHHHATHSAAHRFELATAKLVVVVAIKAVEHGARARGTEGTSLRPTPGLGATPIARATPGPRGSPRSAATAIAGLPVAIAIAVPLTDFRAIAFAWATLTFGPFARLAAITRAAIGAVTTITATVAGATATAGFGPVATGAIAALGVALAAALVAGLAGGLAFFFVQFPVAIFVELLEHSRHPTARTSRFAIWPVTRGALFLSLCHTGHQQHDNWRNGHPDASHLSNLLCCVCPASAVSRLGPLPNLPLTKGCCSP